MSIEDHNLDQNQPPASPTRTSTSPRLDFLPCSLSLSLKFTEVLTRTLHHPLPTKAQHAALQAQGDFFEVPSAKSLPCRGLQGAGHPHDDLRATKGHARTVKEHGYIYGTKENEFPNGHPSLVFKVPGF